MSEIMNDRDRITKWLSKIDLGWLKSEQQRLSKKDMRSKVVTLAEKEVAKAVKKKKPTKKEVAKAVKKKKPTKYALFKERS